MTTARRAGLHVRDLAVRRGGRMLFEGLSFDVAPGAALTVAGANGVGKSSLIRVLAGLLPPLVGSVDLVGGEAWPARLALMAEALALDGDRPLRAALSFWARLDASAGEVDAALAATDLARLAQIPVRLLSTGQRRRAALARVVVSRAWLWLLDEPASGLDAESVGRLETLVAEHRAAGGIVLIATHQPLDVPGAQEIRLA